MNGQEVARPGMPAAGLPAIPKSGVFAQSEVLPIMQAASRALEAHRRAWQEAREDANRKKARAKKVRADLVVHLRTWGNDTTGTPIKTSAERQEWADADPEVQQAELEADLAQTVQMAAHDAYRQALEEFGMLRTMLGMERDDAAAERGGPS